MPLVGSYATSFLCFAEANYHFFIETDVLPLNVHPTPKLFYQEFHLFDALPPAFTVMCSCPAPSGMDAPETIINTSDAPTLSKTA